MIVPKTRNSNDEQRPSILQPWQLATMHSMHTYSFMINAAISMRNFWIKSRIPFFSCPNDQKQHLCNECVKHINNLGGSFQEQQTKIGGRVYSVALVLRDIIWFLVPEITMDLCNCEWFLSALLNRSMKWK